MSESVTYQTEMQRLCCEENHKALGQFGCCSVIGMHDGLPGFYFTDKQAGAKPQLRTFDRGGRLYTKAIEACPQCGLRADLPTTNKGWDENHVYQFNVYPDNLLVITSAHPEAFTEAMETFGGGNRGDRNMEQILHDMGYSAMVASKPEEIREFTL